MGGRGGSSGIGKDNGKYDKNGFLKDDTKAPDVSHLQGSEKQIKYAQDIVNKAFSRFDAKIEELSNPQRINPDLSKKEWNEQRDYQNGEIQDQIDAKNFLINSIKKYTKASHIIDRKESFLSAHRVADEFRRIRREKNPKFPHWSRK